MNIHAHRTTSFYVYKPIARVDVDDIAFFSSLFSDKVDNTDGLNQLQMDSFGCMVQGSFFDSYILSRPSQPYKQQQQK